MNVQPQKLEVRVYDSEPIWEQVLTEIVETRRELCKRLDRTAAIIGETRAGLRDARERLDKIETKLGEDTNRRGLVH
jgi:hypothetical protein